MPSPGDHLRLVVERVATGGRMIARHDGAVVLVAGAIPGEVVDARVERVQRHTVWASTTDVVTRSPDRVDVEPALVCGGHVLAHVAPPRQRLLKGEMIADALRRLGRLPVPEPIDVMGAEADGYRTRARLHVRAGQVGFFDEGTHVLCDVAGSRQLSPASAAVVVAVAERLAQADARLDAEIEWAENVDGTERAVHVTSVVDVGPALEDLSALGLVGATWSRPGEGRRVRGGHGTRYVTDTLALSGATAPVVVRHQPRAFFQSNRYLLQLLVEQVVVRASGTTVCDLYAGVGLFALALAATGAHVYAVEGDDLSAADLAINARAYPDLSPHHTSVEAFLARPPRRAPEVVVIDPPRTGLSAASSEGLLRWGPSRVVYVSCDAATFARDARRLVDGGYALGGVTGLDLFPRTGHVELVASFERAPGTPPRSLRTAAGTRPSARSSPGATGRPGRRSRPTARRPR